jgi:hypothetical protein
MTQPSGNHLRVGAVDEGDVHDMAACVGAKVQLFQRQKLCDDDGDDGAAGVGHLLVSDWVFTLPCDAGCVCERALRPHL